jgi:hypothetical protein
MKNSPIASILLGVLTVCVAASLYLCGSHIRKVRGIREVQSQMLAFQVKRAQFSTLMNDLVAYSKTHKDLEPILEAAGLTNRPTAK